MDYFALFASAFLAATIVPFSSELAVLGMSALERDPVLILAVATLGNTLGAAVNWGLGRYLLRFRERRWFPADRTSLEHAQRWFQRYGVWSLLLAWLPVVGDALTVVAGIMRVNLAVFVALTAIGKGSRYAALIVFANGAVA